MIGQQAYGIRMPTSIDKLMQRAECARFARLDLNWNDVLFMWMQQIYLRLAVGIFPYPKMGFIGRGIVLGHEFLCHDMLYYLSFIHHGQVLQTDHIGVQLHGVVQ